jgi:hypothetical protein
LTRIEKRIRIASLLVVAGLLVEIASFVWKSPLAFFLFLGVACGIAAAGIVLFLISLVTMSQEPGA